MASSLDAPPPFEGGGGAGVVVHCGQTAGIGSCCSAARIAAKASAIGGSVAGGEGGSGTEAVVAVSDAGSATNRGAIGVRASAPASGACSRCASGAAVDSGRSGPGPDGADGPPNQSMMSAVGEVAAGPFAWSARALPPSSWNAASS